MEFFDGATDLGPGSALSGSGGSATSTFTTSALALEGHSITAVYTPTANFVRSTSPALTETVYNFNGFLSPVSLDRALQKLGSTIRSSSRSRTRRSPGSPQRGVFRHQWPVRLLPHRDGK